MTGLSGSGIRRATLHHISDPWLVKSPDSSGTSPHSTGPRLPWPLRGVTAGAAGVAAMTLSYAALRRLRRRGARAATLADGTRVSGLADQAGLDYDDSVVPGRIVISILHLPTVVGRHPGDVAIALRWGYGSAFGLAHVWLRHRLSEPGASILFGGALLTVTFTMFPLLGHTPSPRQWPPDVILTAVGTHVVYVFTAAAVDDLAR